MRPRLLYPSYRKSAHWSRKEALHNIHLWPLQEGEDFMILLSHFIKDFYFVNEEALLLHWMIYVMSTHCFICYIFVNNVCVVVVVVFLWMCSFSTVESWFWFYIFIFDLFIYLFIYFIYLFIYLFVYFIFYFYFFCICRNVTVLCRTWKTARSASGVILVPSGMAVHSIRIRLKT